jgi:hypothetical protein
MAARNSVCFKSGSVRSRALIQSPDSGLLQARCGLTAIQEARPINALAKTARLRIDDAQGALRIMAETCDEGFAIDASRLNRVAERKISRAGVAGKAGRTRRLRKRWNRDSSCIMSVGDATRGSMK